MRISVIIPCYNVERYVERAVSSAIAQTYPDLEVICVDDGSTDGTLALLRRMEEEQPRRVSVIAQTNRGACAARNSGLQKAAGAYLQFLDADDVLLPEKLAHQLEVARRNDLPEVIIGSSRTLSIEGKVVRTVIQPPGEHDPWLDLMAHRLNITSANLWLRSAVENAGGWNESLASSQEYDLMFRILKNGGRFVHDDQVLTEIHQRSGGSISQTNIDRNWVRSIALRAQVIEHLRTDAVPRDLQPFYQVLFDDIRTLYLHDPNKALELHKQLIPVDFRPGLSSATGKGYLLLHNLFGFAGANKIRRMLA